MREDHPLKCPICKSSLENRCEQLKCPQCGKVYNIIDGIPDLSGDEFGAGANDVIEFFNEASVSYESTMYQAQLYQLYAGLPVFSERMVFFTIQQLKKEINSMLGVNEGLVLDLACGTGMFGRNIAIQNSRDLHVYSVDLSLGMLEIAKKFSADENIANNTFIRANVDQLPFADSFFQGVCCCGALQLFPNIEIALEEINRVLKSKAKLVGMTYLKWKNKTSKPQNGYLDKNLFHELRPNELTDENKPRNHGKDSTEIADLKPGLQINDTEKIHFFEIDELGEVFHRTGYDNFKYIIHGHMIVFETQKIN